MAKRRLRIGINARVLAIRSTRGLTRYTTELLRAFSKRDEFDLVLFTREPLHPPHLDGIAATIVQLDRGSETAWSEFYLPRAIHAAGIDVFHAPADRGIPFLCPCPSVVTVHNSIERHEWRQRFVGAKSRAWYWRNELATYFRADAIITVSKTTRDELVAAHVARVSRIHVVYPAPADPFRTGPDAHDARVLSCVPTPYLLYVGGYDEHKNVDRLLEGFAKAGPIGTYLVIAAAKPSNFLAKHGEWERRGLLRRVVFLEPSDAEIPALYRQALAFVNPSLWESFSFQIVEAMACGVPLATSNRTAMPEIAGESALFFDPTDISSIAEAVRRVALDAELRSTLQKRGRERSRFFSWETAARQTAAIYEQVLGL